MPLRPRLLEIAATLEGEEGRPMQGQARGRAILALLSHIPRLAALCCLGTGAKVIRIACMDPLYMASQYPPSLYRSDAGQR